MFARPLCWCSLSKANEPDSIYCGYNPTLCPADLGTVTPFDNKLVLFVGDDLNSAIPVVFEDTATRRSNAGASYNVTYITGPNGHGANPAPILRFDHVASGTAETDEICARPLFLLPKDDGLTMLRLWRLWQDVLHAFLC